MSLVPLWTGLSGASHNGEEPPGCHPGDSPRQGGSLADPLAEGIHKDTDGPDKASDRVQYVAHLPGRYLALADVCASAFRLGHGPHLLPKPSLPGKDTWTFREEVPKGGTSHDVSLH